MKIFKYFWLFLVLLGHARATTLLPLNLESLITKSSFIVLAQVTNRENRFVGDHIWSHYQVRVKQFLKGGGPDILDIVQPGGSKGKYHTMVSGVREFHPGDSLCFFLWTDDQNRLQLIGYSQGSFQLARNLDGELYLRGDSLNHALQNGSMIQKSISQARTPQMVRAYRRFYNRHTVKNLESLIQTYE